MPQSLLYMVICIRNVTMKMMTKCYVVNTIKPRLTLETVCNGLILNSCNIKVRPNRNLISNKLLIRFTALHFDLLLYSTNNNKSTRVIVESAAFTSYLQYLSNLLKSPVIINPDAQQCKIKTLVFLCKLPPLTSNFSRE